MEDGWIDEKKIGGWIEGGWRERREGERKVEEWMGRWMMDYEWTNDGGMDEWIGGYVDGWLTGR